MTDSEGKVETSKSISKLRISGIRQKAGLYLKDGLKFEGIASNVHIGFVQLEKMGAIEINRTFLSDRKGILSHEKRGEQHCESY